ncbi:hypothetical protein IT407_00440 [Candidatus Uhrbacteria bacterium]|nr:hypothetical protein [Candidatus Uhrbacteria bacterium]
MTDPALETHGSNGNGIHTLDNPGPAAKKGRAKKDESAAPKRTADVVGYEVLCESLSPLLMDRFDPQVMVDTLIFGKRTPADRETPLETRCIPKMYRDDEGRVILLDKHLYACLNAAGRSIKIGKEGKLANATDTKLFAVLEIKEMEIPLIFTPGRNPKVPGEVGKNPTSEKPWKGFSRVKVHDQQVGEAVDEDKAALAEATKNLGDEVFGPELDPESPWRVDVQRGVGNTGIANAIVRPCFEEWGFKVTIEVDYTGLEGLTSEHIQQLFERAGKRVGLLSYRPACKGPYGRFKVASFKEISAR